jgi:hypothetical protein
MDPVINQPKAARTDCRAQFLRRSYEATPRTGVPSRARSPPSGRGAAVSSEHWLLLQTADLLRQLTVAQDVRICRHPGHVAKPNDWIAVHTFTEPRWRVVHEQPHRHRF